MKGLAWLGVLLVIAWLFLWLGLKIVSGAIHILLFLGVIAIVWGVIAGAKARRGRL
jgi:hypothetical protein